MPIELLTNAAPAIGSLALLLNPTHEFGPTDGTISNPAEPAADAAAGEEHLLGEWGFRRAWSERGFDFSVQYIAEVAGNVSGGRKRGTVYNGLLIAMVDANLDKLAGWPGGAVHGAMLYPQGRSLTENYVGDLFVLSNIDATDEPRLFELWFEQNFASDTLSLRLGELAADQEFAFTERGALFGNSAFGWFPIAGLNVAAPVYPQGALGARLAWHPRENAYVQAAVFDGDGNPPDDLGNETNPNGIEFTFDEGALILAEAGWAWGQEPNSGTKSGLVKFGGWYHTDTFDNVRLDDTGLSLADPVSSGIPQPLNGNWGLYLAVEQTLWNEPDSDEETAQGLGLFSRLGYAPPDRNVLEFYAELGVTYAGLLPGRAEDVCGLGVAYGQMSRDFRQLGSDANSFDGTSNPLPDHEIAIELGYQCQVRAGWILQPSLQYIVHPGGSEAIDNALVLALRSAFDF